MGDVIAGGTSGTRRSRRGPRVDLHRPQGCPSAFTERKARDRGPHVRAVSLGREWRRLHDRQLVSGTSKIVVDQARGVIVGATFTGPGVQELLHSATIAIVGHVPLEQLWHAVPSFPTISEVWLRLLEAYGL